METYILAISNCGDLQIKLVCSEKISNIKKHYLKECIKNKDVVELLQKLKICKNPKKYEDSKNILSKLSDKKINVLFHYMFKGGYGYQAGDPGKEWVTIKIKKLKDCETIKF